MEDKWLKNDQKFRFLTYCLLQEIYGNPISEKDVVEEFGTDKLLNKLNTKKWIKKKYKYICSYCGEMMYLREDSDLQICNKCNEAIETKNINRNELKIRYEAELFERLNAFIKSIFKFNYDFRKDDFEEIPFSVIEENEKIKKIFFYFSPLYNFKDSVIRSERYPRHFFVNWGDLPNILFEYEFEEMEKRLKMRNKAKNKTIKHFNLSRIDIGAGDYRLLGLLKEKGDQTECTKIINSKGYKEKRYSTFFEKMSISVLFDLFKFAEGFHLGGKNKPDGILFFSGSEYMCDTCFIESKCYSSEFSLNKEKAKAGEYIRKFREYINSEEQFGDISHYILISTNFLNSDIIYRISDYKRDYGLSNFIILSEIQLIALKELYDEFKIPNPSFPRRLFFNSDSYREFLQHLDNFSKNYIEDIPTFNDLNREFFQLVNQKKLQKEKDLDAIFAPKKNIAEIVKMHYLEKKGQVAS